MTNSSPLPTTLDSPSTQRLTFSELPIEILGLVVEAVARQEREDAPLRQPTAGDPPNRILTHSQPTLSALSQVNSCFWRLSAPILWRRIDLEHRGNFDYLFFYHFILPRYGPFIHDICNLELDTAHSVGRMMLPLYLAEALGVAYRYGYSTTRSTPLDIQLLGERLVSFLDELDKPDVPSVGPVEALEFRELRKKTIILQQRARLVSMIIASPAFPNLSFLNGTIYAASDVVATILSHLREAFTARAQPGIDCLDILPASHYSSPLTFEPAEHAVGAKKLQRELAALIRACSHMQAMTFMPPSSLDSEDPWDDYGKPVVDALREHQNLKCLMFTNPHLDRHWATGIWKPLLTFVNMTGLTGRPEDVVAFLGHFRSTLLIIEITFQQDSRDILPASVTPISFPSLFMLRVREETPAEFLEFFAGSPLRFITANRWRDGLSVREWEKAFSLFGKTLLDAKGDVGNLTVEEVVALKAQATKKGWGFFLESRQT